MRHVALALVVLLVAGVLAFAAVSPAQGWWLPAGASTYAAPIDALFAGIGWAILAGFVLVLGLLGWAVWRGARAQPGRARSSHGRPALELAWTGGVGVVLAWIALAQLPTWAALRDPARAPAGGALARVTAQQWSWRVHHAGLDGRFATDDDARAAAELVVPAGEPVLLELVSRDVIHSFFVPELRVKQDVVPGRVIPLWFTVTRTGEYDIVCAELCGLGHYAMAGRLRALARPEYDAWLAASAADARSRGAEDAR